MVEYSSQLSEKGSDPLGSFGDLCGREKGILLAKPDLREESVGERRGGVVSITSYLQFFPAPSALGNAEKNGSGGPGPS